MAAVIVGIWEWHRKSVMGRFQTLRFPPKLAVAGAGPRRGAGSGSDFGCFGQSERIFDVDAKIADGALNLCVS